MINNETSFTGFAFLKIRRTETAVRTQWRLCIILHHISPLRYISASATAPEFSRLMLPQGQPKRNRGNITNRAISLIQNGDRDGKCACMDSSYAVFNQFIQGNEGVTEVVTSMVSCVGSKERIENVKAI